MSAATPRPATALKHWFTYRPELGSETLALLVCLYFSLLCNGVFWHTVLAPSMLPGAHHWLTAASLFVAITALHLAIVLPLLSRWTTKPLLAVLLLVTAMAAHFMSQYVVYLDPDMIRNILHTDSKESRELVSPRLILPLLLYGALPLLLLWRVRLRVRPMRRALAIRAAWLVATLAIAAGATLLSFQPISSLMRNHKEVRHLITPGNYLFSLARVALEDTVPKQRIAVGVHATQAPRAAGSKPRLLLLVIGETVRAQNWGLNGYARQTTPQLAARTDVINFDRVTACGSSTEVSVPCMFSPYGRRHYDKKLIQRSESFLHVLDHAGVATLWRDNQTGCKGVCDGLAFESFEHAQVADVCDAERCLDEVMLRGLQAEADKRTGDLVVVLHQLGNHGPAYFRRYPPRLRKFLPACETSELGLCNREQITNAYDNAILYTDDFLNRAIDQLATMTGRDTALLYVSDHGESLGENGLYLHGVPYAIAPDTQTHVPMLAWVSPGMTQDYGIDPQCLRREAGAPASHDNLFHSVLGLMQVRTPEYNRALDLFAGCRAPAHR